MASVQAFMFPGQGSQSVGMRSGLGDLSRAQQELFVRAEDALGLPIVRLIDEGPEAELTRTSNAQPAMLLMDLAHAEGLRERGHEADTVMGHSLGEYAALVWAGALRFEDAMRAVRTRGLLMEDAATRCPGKMAAVIRVEAAALEAVAAECRSAGVVEITNFNGPDQLVLSGAGAAIDAAVGIIRARKIGRAVVLNVAAPFHSSLMQPAADRFRAAIADLQIRPPGLTFIDNVTGRPESDASRIREKLVDQIVRPVQWEQGMRFALAAGVRRFVESGPGSVLAGLARRIAPTGTSITTSEALLAAVRWSPTDA